MASVSVKFSIGGIERLFDVNVIAQNDVRLIDLLFVHLVDLNDDHFVTRERIFPANRPADWPPELRAQLTNITFAPVFASLSENPHGVTVAAADGLVHTTPWPVAVRSLIVNVVLTVPGQNPPRRPLCVNVHQNVTTLTVTPSSLSIRQGARARASVLATFPDGRPGDVSLDPGHRWQVVSGPFELVTGDDPPRPSPDGQWVRATAASGTGQLRLIPPAHLTPTNAGGSVLTISLTALAPWEQDREVTFLKEFSAGLDRTNDVPNIIFLSEGFTETSAPPEPSATRTQFENLVNTAIAEISTNDAYAPFDTLTRTRSFNFFRLWVASNQHGLSVVEPFFREPKFAREDQRPIPVSPVRPTNTTTPVGSVDNLLFQVGWPTPADLPRDFTAQKTEWDRLYGDPHVRGVTAAIHRGWVALARRSLALEVDTAFGLRQGFRPQCDFAVYTFMTWSPFRTSRADADRMLSRLFATASDGTRVDLGSVWTAGSDRNRVYFLAASPLTGGTRNFPPNEGTITSLSATSACATTPAGATGVVKLAVPSAPSDGRGRSLLSTFTHELAHTFNITDEYSLGSSVTHPPSGSIFANRGWNVQFDEDLRQGGALAPARIRWRWPRIAGAGVLAARPSVPADPPNAPITLVVRKGHGLFIADGLKTQEQPLVRLRPRPLLQNDGGILVNPPFSTLLRVMGRQGDEFTVVKEDPAASFRADDYLTGSVMFVPKFAGGIQQSLVQDAIATIITTTQLPLNRPPEFPCREDNRPQPPYNVIKANLYHGKRPRSLIGLYDGGAFFNCGVYHAAGDCMMRAMRADSSKPTETTIAGNDRVMAESGSVGAPFCHVCRYILIDQINPLAHGAIEATFEELK